MLKRTEVLATMAATIAAGLLQRTYHSQRDGTIHHCYDIDGGVSEDVIVRESHELAKHLLTVIEKAER